ncbi:MAG TPA: MBL fold metallo-hydrolase [Candidatus Baltobacteraceae bacterium]|jgi:glyoxylase-like metal-dependent hydrolase (beta-lactamase superfamily II)
MIALHFPVGPLGCNCSVLGDEATGEAIVVDGGDDVDHIASVLEEHKLRPKYLVHTHAHFDHIGALGMLRERVGGAGLLHPGDRPLYAQLTEQGRWVGLPIALAPTTLDGDLEDALVLRAGSVSVTCIHTPGHTPGSTSFALEVDGNTRILSGDTLFRGSVGRWDLGGTSLEDIVHSIRTKLLDYPDETIVVPGHGPATTIGDERTGNPYLT